MKEVDMKRVLVVGATGYLGRHVVVELKRRGYWVRALSRRSDAFASNEFAPDEVYVGEITQPETLTGLTDNIEYIFSSVGITRQRDKVGFWDVDYRGNQAILNLALAAGVSKYVIISVMRPELVRHLDIVGAREAFVDELSKSGMDYAVVRATGFYSDMMEFLNMANSGRIYLFGSGENRMNPIDGSDAARICADAFDQKEHEIEIGGPDVLSYNEVAKLAFSAVNKSPKITYLPGWLVSTLIAMLYPFNHKLYTTLSFFATAGREDIVAPIVQGRSLADAYRNAAKAL